MLRHLRAAYAVALGVTGDADDAEDVAQDSFIVALERLNDCADPERVENGLYGRTARYFAEQATARGYEVVDLAPAFLERHARGEALEVGPTDSHWNARGHDLVAVELARSSVFGRTFPLLLSTTWNTQ